MNSKTVQQLCMIHQIRKSMKYISHTDLKAIMAGLKAICLTSSEDIVIYHLEEFSEKWDEKYPEEIHRLIYATNPIEGFHRMLRKYTKC